MRAGRGQAAHHNDLFHPQQPGQLQRIVGLALMALPQFAGIERIAGDVERGDLHAAAGQRLLQLPAFGGVSQQIVGIQMGRRRPAAGGHFHAAHLQLQQPIQHLLEG